MAQSLITYLIAHQPRRIKIPAIPIPPKTKPEDIEKLIFDEEMNKRYLYKISEKCYLPAIDMFLNMIDQGFKLSLGISYSLIKQLQDWAPEVLNRFNNLIANKNVELIGTEPYHSFSFLIDIELFKERMEWMKNFFKKNFHVNIKVTDTTELCMSEVIYTSLNNMNFNASFLDGRNWVLGWRSPFYLYKGTDKMKLFVRAHQLSDDIGYRFSCKNWEKWPLMASEYAQWLKDAWGDLIFLAWDFETFGEHHWKDSGIFEFMKWLPGELKFKGIEFLTPSDAIKKYSSNSYNLPLPIFQTTWAGSGGMEFFLGNEAQMAIFRLMLEVLSMAKLTKNEKLLDIALWLLQSDNLHIIQWYGRFGTEAEVSAYFTPSEWWHLGGNRIIWEIQRVYHNVINFMKEYT